MFQNIYKKNINKLLNISCKYIKKNFSTRPQNNNNLLNIKKKVSTLSLLHQTRKNKPITAITAYDYPSSLHSDRAGADLILVGDSLGMVVYGYDSTLPVTLEQMILSSQAVTNARQRALVVGDLPFGTYENSKEQAYESSIRLIKEGGVDAIKLEGGNKNRCETIKHLNQAGISTMGHIGLTPQHINVIGGFRSQGRTATKAQELVEEALRLQDSGCFSIVIECVPDIVAKEITNILEIPTIGIGAGRYTSGQILVYHDLLGTTEHPHYKQFVPKFCKQYLKMGEQIDDALLKYKEEVQNGLFPNENYSPYDMNEKEKDKFYNFLEKTKDQTIIKKEKTRKKLIEKDEWEVNKLY